MSLRPPRLSSTAIESFLKVHFPFISVNRSSIKELVSYEDRNHYFQGEIDPSFSTSKKPGNEYVLKFLNHVVSEDIELVKGLTELKKYLYGRGFNCPFPIPSVSSHSEIVIVNETELKHYIEKNDTLPVLTSNDISGSELSIQQTTSTESTCSQPQADDPVSSKEKQYCVRVLAYIPGTIFKYASQTPEQMYKFGEYMGLMNKEMKQFSHPGLNDRRLHDWDLRDLLPLRKYLPEAVKDPYQCHTLETILNEFETNVSPLINSSTFSSGLIHCDCNSLNVVVIETDDNFQIAGVIDFTDCVVSPYVFELGIAMAHFMMGRDNPLEFINPLITGYLSVFPLSDTALDILYYVVVGRLAQSYINGMWTYQLEPNNKYILHSVAQPGWKLIQTLVNEGKMKCDTIWCGTMRKDYK